MVDDMLGIVPEPQPHPHPHWPDDADHAFVANLLLILRLSRTDQSLSIRDVAALAGVDHGIIARAESMQRIPNLITMRKWVRALGLEWSEACKDAENWGL